MTWIAATIATGWLNASATGAAGLAWLPALVLAWQALLSRDLRFRLLHKVRAFLSLRTGRHFIEELGKERVDIRRQVEELVGSYRAANYLLS